MRHTTTVQTLYSFGNVEAATNRGRTCNHSIESLPNQFVINALEKQVLDKTDDNIPFERLVKKLICLVISL
jgi:hypothetical protein